MLPKDVVVCIHLLSFFVVASASEIPVCQTPTLYIRGEFVSLATGEIAQVQVLGTPIHGTIRPKDVVFETGPTFRVLIVHNIKVAPPKGPRVWVLDRRTDNGPLMLCRILPDLPQDGWPSGPKTSGGTGKKTAPDPQCSKRCRFGAKCIFKDNRPQCACQTLCPARYRPVCGTDGVTYANRCILKRTGCEQRRELRVESDGKCDKCTKVRCAFHGICALSTTGEPFCRCPLPTKQCSGSDGQPVCGSDNITYQDKCHMRVTACTQQKDISVTRHGACLIRGERLANDACKSIVCPHPFHTCRTVKGLPECRCPFSCAGEAKGPVLCGSDGLSHQSPCRLRRQACRKGRDIHMLYQGGCSQPHKCAATGQPCGPRSVCQTDWKGRVRCVCPTCHGIAKDILGSPVCASDGRTWTSECHVRADACSTGQDLRILHEGPCDLCKKKKCKFYARCHVDHRGQPECICPTSCPKTMKPVCGSNGVTYENSCMMKVEACSKEQNITVIAKQSCQLCTKDCPVGTFCLHGQCRCREKCPGLSMPICGKDGKLYRTECDLGRMACLTKRTVDIDLTGELCQKNNNLPLQDQVSNEKSKVKIKENKKIVTNDLSRTGITLSQSSSVTFPPYILLRRYFTIDLTIIPEGANGNLIFLGPKETFRVADTLTLNLHDRYVVYSFNLGSGPLTLRSKKQLQLRRQYRITILRKGRLGKLFVDGEVQTGRSPGRLRGFNIRPDHTFVIGELKTRTKPSFRGCITSATLTGFRPKKKMDLMDQILNSLEGNRVNVRAGCPLFICSPNPCQNGGRCNSTNNVEIKCHCPTGWKGDKCEKKILTTRFQTPSFEGRGYISIPPSLLRIKRRRFELEIWFLTSTLNGLLAQISGPASLGGHFLRIEIINGWLQAACRTKQGLFVMRSEDRVPIGEWVQLQVRKTRRFVLMTANDKMRSRMRLIPRSARRLSKVQKRKMSVFHISRSRLYIAGAPTNPLNEKSEKEDVWLKGAIQRVYVNRRRIDLYGPDVQRSMTVGLWRGPPCSPDRTHCGSGSMCEPLLNNAQCICLNPPCPEGPKSATSALSREDGFLRDEGIRAINFNGITLLKMKNKGLWQQRKSFEDNVVMKLKTSKRNGLVMIMTDSKRNSPAEEFFLIALRKGFPEAAWSLGGPHCIIRIRGPKRISDNRWHELHALRNGGLATLLVDGFPVSGQLNCSKKTLNTDGWMWLGGYRTYIRGFPLEYNQGFMGCIQHVIIDTEEMKLQDLATPKRGDLKPCSVPYEF